MIIGPDNFRFPGVVILAVLTISSFTFPSLVSKSANASSDVALTPQDIRNAYDVSPLIQSGYTGKGITIAIIGVGIYDYAFADLQTFDQYYALPKASVSVVRPYGTYGTGLDSAPGLSPSEDDVMETTADIELAHAMAPDARILLVLTGATSILYGFSYVIENHAADVATISYTSYGWGPDVIPEATVLDWDYSRSVGENITLIAASGDWGSNNSLPVRPNSSSWYEHLPNSVMVPQYSPYVTAIGGTNLAVEDGRYVSESGWYRSGGGPSNYINQPAWQKGQGIPANRFRDIPDIALDASESTPYSVYESLIGGWGLFAGTSGGAPTFAGIVADIDQAMSHPIGFLNPSLYALASIYPWAFHDVTDGCSFVTLEGYFGYCSGRGWDFVTGLGSPDAVALLNYLRFHKATPSTTVKCDSLGIAPGKSIKCTALVQGDSPNGTITWSTGGSGSVTLSSPICALSSGECKVTVTAVSVGPVEMIATYGGDSNNLGSSGELAMTVSRVFVTCNSGVPPTVGRWTKCTVTVRIPGALAEGSVSWSSNNGVVFYKNTNTCTLSPKGNCAVTFKPTSAGSVIVTADYEGDSSSAEFTVSKVATLIENRSLVHHCSSTLAVNSTIDCTIELGCQPREYCLGLGPSGWIGFSRSSPDMISLSSTFCQLDRGKCQIKITGIKTGLVTLQIWYTGDSSYESSVLYWTMTVKP